MLSIAAGKAGPNDNPALQLFLAVTAYLGYFFAMEWALGWTVGKLVTGLRVCNLDGGRCTWRQIAVRTVYRLLEVNPFLLGAWPAAVRIIWSRDKQRFGDWAAGTLVVFR